MRRCQIIFESKYNVNDVLSKTDAERTYLERLEQKYPGLKTQGGIRYIVGDETGDNLSISINVRSNSVLTWTTALFKSAICPMSHLLK